MVVRFPMSDLLWKLTVGVRLSIATSRQIRNTQNLFEFICIQGTVRFRPFRNTLIKIYI